jgi:hypothetical protein
MFFILSFLFSLLQNQRTGGGTGPDQGGGLGKVLGKEDRRLNTVQKCVHIYANAKMIPVKTTPRISKGGIKKKRVERHCNNEMLDSVENANSQRIKKDLWKLKT